MEKKYEYHGSTFGEAKHFPIARLFHLSREVKGMKPIYFSLVQVLYIEMFHEFSPQDYEYHRICVQVVACTKNEALNRAIIEQDLLPSRMGFSVLYRLIPSRIYRTGRICTQTFLPGGLTCTA